MLWRGPFRWFGRAFPGRWLFPPGRLPWLPFPGLVVEFPLLGRAVEVFGLAVAFSVALVHWAYISGENRPGESMAPASRQVMIFLLMVFIGDFFRWSLVSDKRDRFGCLI